MPVDPEDTSPIALADLMMATPLRRRANLVILEPAGSGYQLFVKRGSSTLAAIEVSSDVGNAAVARLAQIAEIDPFEAVDQGEGRSARVRVRMGEETAELLVSLGISPDGLDVELRPLLINGRALEQPEQGQLKRCVLCGTYQAPQRETCEFDGGDLMDVADDPRPDGTIGVYRVGAALGNGGMGTVYSAVHALIGRPVAIKLPHDAIAASPTLSRRFLAEARAASRLRHPNIVDVTDYGVMSDGRPYMVMERLEGEALRDRLARDGALPIERALVICREVALALGAAHNGGVVHRDLKPDNIILLETPHDADGPRIKLVDFGAAVLASEEAALRAAGSADGTADGEQTILGTPWYMAPEHSRGEPTDGRTDIYALGVVLYEMLAGRPPFDGQDATEVRLAHMTRPIPDAVSPFEPLPEAVRRVLSRALRKRPDERYQSASEMVVDIDKALQVVRRRDWRKWLPI